MISRTSCGWCHASADIPPPGATPDHVVCRACGHNPLKPRMLCDCRVCKPPRLRTSGDPK